MRLKILAGILLTALLCATVFTAATLKLRNNKATALAKERGQAQIEVIQLPADGGVVPLTIHGEKILINPANGVMELEFFAQNNTSENISAVYFTIIGKAQHDNGKGEEFSSKGGMRRDFLIHPDILDMHHLKPFAPGTEQSFGPEPIEIEDGAVLRGITLKVDYVEFEDKTTVGPNERGSIMILKTREGATKYKAWLAKKYEENGRSISALISLLRDKRLPADINLGDHERTGAIIYRNHMVRAYDMHGAAQVEKYFNP
jgi:hypothetical protein